MKKNRAHMILLPTKWCKSNVTNVTFVRFYPLMNRRNMVYKPLFWLEVRFAFWASEKCFLCIIMNRYYMFLHVTSSGEKRMTYYAYVSRVFSFMDCLDMIFKLLVSAKEASHLLQLCWGLFILCTLLIWVFRWGLWVKSLLQMLHENSFFPSWTVAICPVKTKLVV